MSDFKPVPAPGTPAPDFTMPATGGKPLSLKDFAGRPLVLYFYPKDNTPGCTTEACDFRDSIARFSTLKAAVVGVSRDSVASHEAFAKKFSLTFPLASDTDGSVCEAYGAWGEKRMMGRAYKGILRTTFLIDAQGRIARVWQNVKVADHVAEVAQALETL